jgi:hypothetical protein
MSSKPAMAAPDQRVGMLMSQFVQLIEQANDSAAKAHEVSEKLHEAECRIRQLEGLLALCYKKIGTLSQQLAVPVDLPMAPRPDLEVPQQLVSDEEIQAMPGVPESVKKAIRDAVAKDKQARK